jgi:4-diphosphocytidyl-2-C-methyl-D-erythritol kinase
VVPVKALVVPAFAKLNLGLEVLGVRDDGFHELRTLFQSIDLHDDVRLAPARTGVAVRCDHKEVPQDGTNLAHRAAAELRRRAGVKSGVEITITKRIPVGGGLGGGSSNAAAVLLGLDQLWGLGLGRIGLERIARRLGADVPYFLTGGTALGLARGDEVYPLAEQVRGHVVLVPSRPVSTAAVFKRVDAELTPRENSLTISRFVSSDLKGAVRFGILQNELERAALEEAPDVAESARRMRVILEEEGAVLAQMSGSGSTFFGLFERRAGAVRARKALAALGLPALLARTLSLAEYRDRHGRSLRRARAGASGDR